MADGKGNGSGDYGSDAIKVLKGLELAETVVRATGSKSPIVFEALPVDDPQVRQPDITRARQLLGWEPEIALEEGLRRTITSLGREPAVA